VSNRRLVYSTDGGRVTSEDASPRSSQKAGVKLPDDGVVRIFRERAGRGGKVVTVIRGLPGQGPALAGLAGDLKHRCGAGGTVKGDAIEIQGDHRERVAARLREKGYTVKLAGG
jgi:translation initiation factor 1